MEQVFSILGYLTVGGVVFAAYFKSLAVMKLEINFLTFLSVVAVTPLFIASMLWISGELTVVYLDFYMANLAIVAFLVCVLSLIRRG